MGDFSDSEDVSLAWPKELPQLKNIDDRLHCPICYNYMKNPVISTTCSHNFCSLCIRNNISLKNSCPICFIDISDGMLRPNRCLEEIIKCFQPVKNYVLKAEKIKGKTNFGMGPEETFSSHLCRENKNSGHESPPGKNSDLPSNYQQLHASQMASANTFSAQCSNSMAPSTPICQEKSQKTFSSPHVSSLSRPVVHQQRASSSQAVKEVACPICNVYMRETVINIHLDSCLNKNKPVKRKPLPKLIYNLMKDAELKKRLKELGLSSTGDKATLINRHKKYTILYNSECDAAEPRSVAEVRAQFEQEEAESRRIATELRYAITKAKSTDVETIEKENIQYIRNNKESYDRLINDIRQRQSVKSETTPRKEENVPLQEDIAGPSKVEEDEAMKSLISLKANDSDDEVTVLAIPPKVYETISLSDSSECDEPPPRTRTASSGSSSSSSEERGTNSRNSSSSCSIPDPMESNNSSSSIEGLTISLSTTGSSSGSCSSPSYSPADESKLSHQFGLESSSSSSPLPTAQSKTGKKRSKSPLEASSERKMSLRRKI